MPSVSIVIPAYNAESTIAETLASVRAQTFNDFEVLVVDDGSSDDTAAAAAAAGDSRVRVIHTPNGGVSRARNRGIAEAQAELVAFLDADDLWQPDKLERQVAALAATPEAGFCVTGAVRIDAASHLREEMPLIHSEDVCHTLLLNAMAVGCVSSGMARKAVLNALGAFDPRFSQCADWDLWLRMSSTTHFLVIDDPLVWYRTSPGNMSGNIDLLERDTFAVLDAFFASERSAAYRPLQARVYGNHWMTCSGSYLHRGRLIDAARCLLTGVRTYPPSIRRPLGLPKRWALRMRRRAGIA